MANKKELYNRLLDLSDNITSKDMIIGLCNYFSTRELEEFVEFLEKEWS